MCLPISQIFETVIDYFFDEEIILENDNSTFTTETTETTKITETTKEKLEKKIEESPTTDNDKSQTMHILEKDKKNYPLAFNHTDGCSRSRIQHLKDALKKKEIVALKMLKENNCRNRENIVSELCSNGKSDDNALSKKFFDGSKARIGSTVHLLRIESERKREKLNRLRKNDPGRFGTVEFPTI